MVSFVAGYGILNDELFGFRARLQEASIQKFSDQYEAYLAEPREPHTRPVKDLVAW
jgi:hypothetical protein